MVQIARGYFIEDSATCLHNTEKFYYHWDSPVHGRMYWVFNSPFLVYTLYA